MIKSELVRRIAARSPHLRHRDVEVRVNAMFTAIVDALARGDRVELRGFGSFSIRQRRAREGRNPRNGTPVAVAGKAVPMFRTGRAMHAKLQDEIASRAERLVEEIV